MEAFLANPAVIQGAITLVGMALSLFAYHKTVVAPAIAAGGGAPATPAIPAIIPAVTVNSAQHPVLALVLQELNSVAQSALQNNVQTAVANLVALAVPGTTVATVPAGVAAPGPMTAAQVIAQIAAAIAGQVQSAQSPPAGAAVPTAPAVAAAGS